MAALNHARPDRIPRYDILFKSFTDNWRAAKNLPAEVDAAAHYRLDIPGLFAVQSGPFRSRALPEQRQGDFVVSRDTWGRTIRRLVDSGFSEVVSTAIENKTDLDRLEFDDPGSPAYREALPNLSGQTAYPYARVSGTMGLFQACTWLRGDIPFMINLLDDESFCRTLIGRLKDFLAVLGEQVARRTQTLDSAFWVYDDFSINTWPMISPDVFARLFLEPYRALLGHWKSIGIRHLILHHDILNDTTLPIIDMFLDAGITGVQGVYPTAGLSLPRFKARYGKRLAVIGGMCNTHTLPFGSRADIERQAAAIVDAGRDGGVIIGSHSIEGYIPVANYDTYIGTLDRLENVG